MQCQSISALISLLNHLTIGGNKSEKLILFVKKCPDRINFVKYLLLCTNIHRLYPVKVMKLEQSKDYRRLPINFLRSDIRHTKYLWFTMSIWLILVAGCAKDDPNVPQPEPQKEGPEMVVAASENVKPVFTPEGGSASVSFTAGGDWTASLSNERAAEWISFTPTSGKKGKGTLSITVKPNETPDELNASIILKSGSESVTIVATQKQKNALTVTSDKFEIAGAGGEVEVEVKANIDFEVDLLADWISETTTRALKTTNLTFQVEANESGEPRVGKIVIHSEALSDTVTVYQDFHRHITLAEKHFDIPDTGGSVVVEINSSVEYGSRFLAGADWVSEVTTRALSTHTLHFEVSANESPESRTARILFYAQGDESINDTVTIYQHANEANNPARIEREALMALYDATNGSQWSNSTNWGSDLPLNEWYGVQMKDGRVTNLMLQKNNLDGAIPGNIGELEYLEFLSLSGNLLEGDIPTGITELSRLKVLRLDDNYLTGTIPVGFVDIPSLSVLKLSNNCLSGLIPSSLYGSPQWMNVWIISDILPQRDGYELTFDIYQSTDFSEHGKVHLLNSHTKGKGIKIVVMGDGYSDRMVADGTYMQAMTRAMENFFKFEPYRSHRDYFDFYAVTAVSKNEYIDRLYNDTTALGTVFDGSSVSNDAAYGGAEALLETIDEFKDEDGNIPKSELVVIVLMNNNVKEFRSFCLMYSDGFAVTLCFQAGEEEGLVAHEAGGHGFGKLADEYVEQGNTGVIPDEQKRGLKSWQSLGYYTNVDIVSNPSEVAWSLFLEDERYVNENLGMYEGAYLYPKGVYRSRQNSIMRYHWEGDGFNAPSRMAIFKRIKELAGEEFALEEFLAYDEINRSAFRSGATRTSTPAVVDWRRMPAPPVLFDYPSTDKVRRGQKERGWIPSHPLTP